MDFVGFLFRRFVFSYWLDVVLCFLVVCLEIIRCLNVCLDENGRVNLIRKIILFNNRNKSDIKFVDIY